MTDPTTVRLGLIQMVSSSGVDVNLAHLELLMAKAAGERAEIVFLPENFPALGANDTYDIARHRGGVAGDIFAALAGLARRYKLWIAAGTMPCVTRPDGSPVDGDRVRAASYLLDANGHPVGRYDKIHMFDVDVADNQQRYRESDRFEPGQALSVYPTPAGRLGLSVCYDLRFPEVYRELVKQGAEIIAVPSAFTEVTGEAHFELLMRARAVENACFMVAACQGGVHDSGRRTWGHSMVVGPWGDILVEMERDEGVAVCDINLPEVTRLRDQMPVARQRRLKYTGPDFR